PSASLKCYAGFLASLLWYLGLKPATAPMQHASRYLLAIELRMRWLPIRGWRNLCAKRQERSIRGGFRSQPMTGHTSTSKGAGFREPTTQWDCSSSLPPPGCTRRSRQLPARSEEHTSELQSRSDI